MRAVETLELRTGLQSVGGSDGLAGAELRDQGAGGVASST